MVPKSSSPIAASLFSSVAKIALGPSPLRHFGEPDLPPARARVRCGLKGRSSRGMPSSATATSIFSATSASCGPAWIPIQNTRAAFAVGKNPYPAERISNALPSTRRKRSVMASTRSERLFSDELQRDVQRLRPHPACIGREALHAFEKARDAGANFRVDIDSNEYSHLLIAVAYSSALRIISSACCVANWRIRLRSPGKFRSTTCVPSSPASAM